MPVSREDVIAGFRMILGRHPGPDAGIQGHMALRDETELAAVLLQCEEFRGSDRFKDFLQVREPDPSRTRFEIEHASRSRLRVLVVGNCQVSSVARLMQAMTGDIVARSIEAVPAQMKQIESGDFALEPLLAESDLVFVQPVAGFEPLVQQRHPQHLHKLRHFPPINYGGFHPDCVYIRRSKGGYVQGRMGDYHSSIVFWAWRQGWSVKETAALFKPEIFEALGFGSHHEAGAKVLAELGAHAKLPLEPLLDRWMARGVWMHTVNHPHIAVLADLAEALLRREGIEPMVTMGRFVEDTLAHFPIWPVYPGLGRDVREESLLFKLDTRQCPSSARHVALSLDQFIASSFERYRAVGRDDLVCERVDTPAYGSLVKMKPGGARWWKRGSEEPTPRSPYAELPDHHFWRRMMEQVPASEVDPVRTPSWLVRPEDKVATAGSCFAQHIARTLKRQGFNYFVTEGGESLDATERIERQFGVFSARYGNLYTARQLVQLIDRAYGRFQPLDTAWRRADGRLADPFRPQVEPAGFASAVPLQASRDEHLAAVRRLVEEMDVFVFTLGLTEAWQRRADGAVFPLAPGVVAGEYDPKLYSFVNFGFEEVVADVRGAVRRMRAVNPAVRFIFTVSPVPLIATYEDRHVLISTVESKAILRSAIAEVARSERDLDYFPSYEIITGPHARGAYFAADLRSVTDEGVAHVMRLFMKHYGGSAGEVHGSMRVSPGADVVQEQRRLSDVICDEEAIEAHRRMSV